MTKLRELRRAKGVKQYELAAKAGISQPFLHDLERGNRNAKPETLARIAAALDCTVAEIKEAPMNED